MTAQTQHDSALQPVCQALRSERYGDHQAAAAERFGSCPVTAPAAFGWGRPLRTGPDAARDQLTVELAEFDHYHRTDKEVS